MVYTHEQYQLEIEGNRGTFYNNGNLQFMGDAYIAMKAFINSCNTPQVTEKFHAQLSMREECRFKNQPTEVKENK
tara:strand:+ start:5774 stop:5998 length:225 start_codon:yes stop_codon:yes gene_type:complete